MKIHTPHANFLHKYLYKKRIPALQLCQQLVRERESKIDGPEGTTAETGNSKELLFTFRLIGHILIDGGQRWVRKNINGQQKKQIL